MGLINTSINNMPFLEPLFRELPKDRSEFFHIQIIRRKKDGNLDMTAENQVIRHYTMDDYQKFMDKHWDEFMREANTRNARIYVNPTRKSHRAVTMDLLVEIANRIKIKEYRQVGIYETAVGRNKGIKDGRIWVMDVDYADCDAEFKDIIEFIPDLSCMKIHTKNGYHLLCKPFDAREFYKKFPEITVQKNNPTVLYCP